MPDAVEGEEGEVDGGSAQGKEKGEAGKGMGDLGAISLTSGPAFQACRQEVQLLKIDLCPHIPLQSPHCSCGQLQLDASIVKGRDNRAPLKQVWVVADLQEVFAFGYGDSLVGPCASHEDFAALPYRPLF